MELRECDKNWRSQVYVEDERYIRDEICTILTQAKPSQVTNAALVFLRTREAMIQSLNPFVYVVTTASDGVCSEFFMVVA